MADEAPRLTKAEQDAQLKKIQPKLRMVLNGTDQVNAVRAEHSAALRSGKSEEEVPLLRGDEAAPGSEKQVGGARGKLMGRVATEASVNVFARLSEASDQAMEKLAAHKDRGSEVARRLDMATATLTLDGLERLKSDKDAGLVYVEMGEPLTTPTPSGVTTEVAAPTLAERKIGGGNRHLFGRDVLVGIVDVQGFDFAHPDFIDPKTKDTRFVAIWDQGGELRQPPSERREGRAYAAFNYGSELHGADLNAAIRHHADNPHDSLPPTFLERQSQMVAGSHGTHVASIAAGNKGVCRRAKIAAVLVHLPTGDLERRRSFYDSTRLAHAVDYLFALGDELGLPVVVNVSLGTNGHAHDGSSAINRWIDSALTQPGRVVVAAAGNAGQEEAEFEGDIGYVMGRIHTSGRVPAQGLARDLEWLVVGNSIADISENELEVWYGSQDRFDVTVWSPGGERIGPIGPGQFVENKRLKDGAFISIYNEMYHEANGENYIAVYLSPFFGTDGIIGVTAGKWRVRLGGTRVRDGRFHAWIERDDPRRIGKVGHREAWVFPSFFADGTWVDDSTVSSLACGHRVISVANLDRSRNRIHVTSSQGPTRDNRFKPDVAAQGTDVVAANGFAGKGPKWVSMTGTSMAAPFVTGVAGLMLAARRELTAAQIEGILRATSRPLPGMDYRWQNNAGFGEIDPDGCMEEAVRVAQREDRTDA